MLEARNVLFAAVGYDAVGGRNWLNNERNLGKGLS